MFNMRSSGGEVVRGEVGESVMYESGEGGLFDVCDSGSEVK